MKILIVLYLFFSSFVAFSQAKNNANLSNRYDEFYSLIKKQFSTIDSLRYNIKYDSLTDVLLVDSLQDIANSKIVEIIKAFKSDIFQFPDTSDYDLLYITKSSDNNFILASWDTRQGGTMIDFASLALFKTKDKVIAKMILNTGEDADDPSNTLMHYNSIETIKNINGEKIYVAWGNGQGSTAIPWQEVRAFTIRDTILVQPAIFPRDNVHLFVSFDTHAFKEGQRIPSIKIKNKGKDILVPIPNDSEGFSGNYRRYHFNGKRYIKQ